MKKTTTLLLITGISLSAYAREMIKPAGGGVYNPPTAACLSPSDYARINTMLAGNIIQLKAKGKLPQDWGQEAHDVLGKPTAGTFIWPLQQQPGFSYNSYYGISNYVDLNPAFPGQVVDWNCGSRSYDLPGYNHQGIDIFLWPFAQRMQENEQVAIIAATDGVIIAKDNGNTDHNCAMGNDAWNAVYIGNADGTICWYGHMKNNSQTVKGPGESVTAGEFLGFVGSSGSSTAPHLHFETHAAGGEIMEPFAGVCNPGQSLWASQKPYIEPTINAVMTHNHAPVFPACPQLETINSKDDFQTGDTVFFATYFHDQTWASPVTYTIYKPDNSVFQTWDNIPQVAYYTASYWYWYWRVNSSWPGGEWHFTVSYEGNTINHTFRVNNNQTGITAGQEDVPGISVFPVPNNGSFEITGIKQGKGPLAYTITDLSGAAIAKGSLSGGQEKITLSPKPAPGIYLLRITAHEGPRTCIRFSVL